MRKNFFILMAVIFLIVVGRFAVKGIQYLPVVIDVFFKKDIALKKDDQRINILLLGTGGGKHDGPNLSDTIIFLSLDISHKKATLISIPRDLWIPDLKEKINTAYAIGEAKRPGGGLLLAKTVVSKVLKQPVDYSIRVDFNGFVKAVDLVGGIDVEVERSFDDNQYPVEEKREDLCGHTLEDATTLIATMSALEVFPCRYKHIHFDRGNQHLDGEHALMFVRSRYATGAEGTDFARSKRQEKVLAAFREKIFSAGTFLQPAKMLQLYDILKGSIDTNIQQSEFDDFIRLANSMKDAKIHSVVLDYGDENKPGLLINPPISDYGQWVLIPRSGDANFTEIHSYTQCVLEKENCTITSYGKPR
jgi:LCP family protein required for cell wall assembly